MIMLRKKHPRFIVPNFGAKSRKRVKDRWRSQRGIDNKKRIKKSGYGKMPSIGYKNSDEVRFKESNGLMKFVVHSKNELNSILDKRDYEVVLASELSKRKKAELQRLAEMHGLKVANKVKI